MLGRRLVVVRVDPHQIEGPEPPVSDGRSRRGEAGIEPALEGDLERATGRGDAVEHLARLA
jgi:hypothetical protein